MSNLSTLHSIDDRLQFFLYLISPSVLKSDIITERYHVPFPVAPDVTGEVTTCQCRTIYLCQMSSSLQWTLKI